MNETAATTLPLGRVSPHVPIEERVRLLREAACAVRRRDLEMVKTAGLGHLGGDFSSADILVVLLLAVLNIEPRDPRMADRDRFVMSKGHCSGALYATLAAARFFDVRLLDDYMKPLSALNGHPDTKKVPGVEANTGPLGHGLPVAVGMAIAADLDRSSRRIFCLVGDGELQEGSNWEALMVAGHRRLQRLTVIVDRNGLQQGATTEATSTLEPLADRAKAFGWAVCDIDGHDHRALLERFENLPLTAGRPSFIIARTHKGYPVSFMQDRVEWHHKVPSNEQVRTALEELV